MSVTCRSVSALSRHRCADAVDVAVGVDLDGDGDGDGALARIGATTADGACASAASAPMA
jgi:hypothetical protein